METSEDSNDHTCPEEHGLFPTAVSKEELDKVRRKSSFKQNFGSSRLSVALGEKRCHGPELQGNYIIQSKAAEHYMNGKEAMRKSQYEEAVICFSKAATLLPQQSQMYVGQAEAYLQLCDFHSAAACYRKAQLLEPGTFSGHLAFIYYLQGQCLFERGLFSDALEAFRQAAEWKPGCRAHMVRSLACLAAAGHYADCLKMVNDWMVSSGPTSDLYLLRARLHQRLHQTSQFQQDVKSALALKPMWSEARALLLQLQEATEWARQQAVERAVRGQLQEALWMIDLALENCPQDAHLCLFRGSLYRLLKDFPAAIEDLVRAVELSEDKGVRGQAEASDRKDNHGPFVKEVEFQLVLTYNDFAIQCFRRGLYAEATLLLNRAIEEEKGKAGLYLNRGDCFFKQGEWCYALADYQQAEEMMRPDDPAVRLRLAVLHNTLGTSFFKDGCFHKAVDMFSLAIQYDPSVSQYYQNRAKSFKRLLNMEAARRDMICTLILDPTKEELPAMLMSLFPGRRVSDVLSSPAGQLVRDQLMDSIQARASFSETQRLWEKFPLITLDKQSIARHPEESSEAGLEQEIMVISVRRLLQALTGTQSQASDDNHQ